MNSFTLNLSLEGDVVNGRSLCGGVVLQLGVELHGRHHTPIHVVDHGDRLQVVLRNDAS